MHETVERNHAGGDFSSCTAGQRASKDKTVRVWVCVNDLDELALINGTLHGISRCIRNHHLHLNGISLMTRHERLGGKEGGKEKKKKKKKKKRREMKNLSKVHCLVDFLDPRFHLLQGAGAEEVVTPCFGADFKDKSMPARHRGKFCLGHSHTQNVFHEKEASEFLIPKERRKDQGREREEEVVKKIVSETKGFRGGLTFSPL